MGFSITIDANDPALKYSRIPFANIDGRKWWPDGPYEVDVSWGDISPSCFPVDGGSAASGSCCPVQLPFEQGGVTLAQAFAPLEGGVSEPAVMTNSEYCHESASLGFSVVGSGIPFTWFGSQCFY